MQAMGKSCLLPRGALQRLAPAAGVAELKCVHALLVGAAVPVLAADAAALLQVIATLHARDGDQELRRYTFTVRQADIGTLWPHLSTPEPRRASNAL